MMLHKFLFVTVLVAGFSICSSYSQNLPEHHQLDPVIIEDLLENVLKDDDTEIDYSELEEQLTYYLSNPINLNAATHEDLAALLFLSDLQIQDIINHREESGAYISVYELQSIASLDELSLRRLLPFVRITSETSNKTSKFKKVKHDLILRYGRILESQAGYLIDDEERSRYLGTPDHLLIRYRLRLENKFQLAINMEKDPGEEFFGGNQRQGFDYYSASLHLQNIGKFKSIVIGDYSVAFGQGLGIWNGYSFGKGAIVHNVARNGIGVRPHTSTNEVQYFRGLATTINLGSFEFSPFISYNAVDGTLTKDSIGFSSLGSSGFHRTPAEIRNRRSVDMLVYGGNLVYSSSSFKIGGTYSSIQYDKPRAPNQQLYNSFAFRGNSLSNTSLYYQYTYKNMYLFGEGAVSNGHGFGLVNGMIASLSDQLSFVGLHRFYQKDFYSFLNRPFSENSNATNEKGLYTGLIWNPNRRIEWVAYADYFRFPWVRYRVDGPSEGIDLFSHISYAPTRTSNFSIRFRYRNKQENLSDGSTVNILENVVRHQLRLQASYKISESLDFRNRAEMVAYQKGTSSAETGWMLYHDLLYQPMGKAISGNVRLAGFKTDGYNSRLYVFENNVLYAHSSIPYFNEGLRLYVNMRYRVNRKINFWIRYASFFYKDQGIGSGLNFIDGRSKSEIRLQLRFQL
ncbi:ComEA family DNA-binding protein [Albibacterium profundi]|uniref:Helix-hairpin-helix domain-containing protein n=1 Tax=Albibacterium profundi TaxID=3134906 RepID=A0ABV5CA09_9SPHI